MNPRRVAFAMVAATSAYVLFALWRAWLLVDSGNATAIFLGIALLALPLLGIWVLWREVRFGFAMQQMGRVLAQENGLPADDLPKAPSGRPEREAADARFVERRAQVEADPDDWRTWFRLALAYDDARDRKRARKAMRQALALFTPTL